MQCFCQATSQQHKIIKKVRFRQTCLYILKRERLLFLYFESHIIIIPIV